MFIGHFAVGLGLKSLAPRVSLGTLFLAAQFIDLLWPSLLLLGIERVEIAPGITRVTPLDFTHYPISHSLLAVGGWALLFALVYFLLSRSQKAAIACAVAVLSHWFLDLLAHRPDLPLYPGDSPLFGFGLWNSLAATLAVEISIFALGTYFYLRHTAARDRIGSIGFWALIVFLLAVYLGNLFGEPPPNTTALAWVGQAQWLLVAWGYWVDKHRRTLDFNFS